MSASGDGAAFQESVVHLHEYLMGLGFMTAARGLVDDIKDALQSNESSAPETLDKKQRKLQVENSVLLRELFMILTDDRDGQRLAAWLQAKQ